MHIAAQIAKYVGLSLLWIIQYTCYVPFVALPLAILRALGKVGIVLLACSVIGWPVLIIWLVFLKDRPRKERRSALRPWGI